MPPPTSDPTGKPNRSGAATRAKIIDAAIVVFAEKGFAGFTLQAVADRAGVFYGNVTHHYPTRDKLIEAMIEASFAAYRARFDSLVASIDTHEGGPIRALIGWFLDDAFVADTPVFLELWAMSSRMPYVADGLRRLYDDALDTSMRTLGVEPYADSSRRFREALYLLSAVMEGTMCLFFNRDRADGVYDGFRREAIDALVPLLEARLAEAKLAAG